MCHPGGVVTARDEVLTAARHLAARSADGTFYVADVVRHLRASGSDYAEPTIRTHVTSRMCADAPDHHAKPTTTSSGSIGGCTGCTGSETTAEGCLDPLPASGH
jgi:hypothetical protein